MSITKKAKVIISSGIANSFEWYDYALFAHFAVVIGKLFFPNGNPKLEIISSFIAFAVGYLMRPFGGIIFGTIGDKYGRKIALSSAVICMALPTFIIGILPTYQQIGIWAPILLTFVRMIQGLSMGGALTGSVSFMIEHTEKSKHGLVGSVSMTSICIGILLGSLVAGTFEQNLSQEEFYSWGWRIPFLIGIIIMFVGFYIKKHTLETPKFEEAKARGVLQSSPLKYTIKNYYKDMIISVLINSTGSVAFYVQAVYIINYLKTQRNFAHDKISLLVNLLYVAMMFLTIFAGYLSDKIGRKKIYIINLILIIISAYPLFYILEKGSFTAVIISQFYLAILVSFYIGPEPALQADFYPTRIRNTAMSLSYNIGTSFFGGTTPYIIAYIIFKNNGETMYASVYLIICAILSLISLYFYKDRSEER